MMLVFFTRGCEVETDEGTRERERKEENKPFEVKNRLPPNTSTSSREKKGRVEARADGTICIVLTQRP